MIGGCQKSIDGSAQSRLNHGSIPPASFSRRRLRLATKAATIRICGRLELRTGPSPHSRTSRLREKAKRSSSSGRSSLTSSIASSSAIPIQAWVTRHSAQSLLSRILRAWCSLPCARASNRSAQIPYEPGPFFRSGLIFGRTASAVSDTRSISRCASAVFPCLRYRVASPKCACPAKGVSFSMLTSSVQAFSATRSIALRGCRLAKRIQHLRHMRT